MQLARLLSSMKLVILTIMEREVNELLKCVWLGVVKYLHEQGFHRTCRYVSVLLQKIRFYKDGIRMQDFFFTV